jgi:HD domain
MNGVTPDPDRLGGIGWARRSGGRLTPRERRRLLAAIAVGQWENLVGRAKLALGRLPAGAAAVDVRTFDPPDSRLASAAEEACREQPASLVGHSFRTWLFGRALAALDGSELDPELFYCAALVHDHGISPPTPGRDFTLASADRVLACAGAAGLGTDLAELLADAICVHTTPGVSLERDGALGCYLQWGAMVDGAGLRIWDVSPANVSEVLRRHPRGDFKRELTALVKANATAVPGGRFSLLTRCGLPLAVRLAPFDT